MAKKDKQAHPVHMTPVEEITAELMEALDASELHPGLRTEMWRNATFDKNRIDILINSSRYRITVEEVRPDAA